MTAVSSMVAKKDAVLFDLFHTLTALESTWSGGPGTCELLGVSREAWNDQLLLHSRDRLVGAEREPLVLITRMAHAIDPRITEAAIERAVENRIERFAQALIHIPEESQRVLRELKARGKLLALVSNADVSEVAAWERSPIAGLFHSTVISCHAGCLKPEPEIYLKALRELEAEPGRSVFVGDGGSRELEGARALGITTVMMTGVIREIWPERIEKAGLFADYRIESLAELLPD